jgi:hypothetical protein
VVDLLLEFSPDQGLLGQSRYTCRGGCLATRYRAAETAFSQPSPLGIACSTADADDPFRSGSTERLEALPPLRLDLGEAL